MLLILTSGVTMGLIVLVSLLYRGQDRRINLLRVTCLGLLVSTLCRELGVAHDTVVLDLCKRLSLLVAQAAVALLVISFQSRAYSRRLERNIIIMAISFGIAHIVVAPFLPLYEHGSILHKSDIEIAEAMGQAWSLVLYHMLGWIPFGLATTVVAEGSRRIMLQRSQPASIRIATSCIFIGSLLTSVFILITILSLTNIPYVGDKNLQKALSIIVVLLFVVGLAIGVFRRLITDQRRRFAIWLAAWAINPLWRAVTTLHPDVRLEVNNHTRHDPMTRLTRMTIETHDALRLIREEDDPALESVYRQHHHDPELSAHLLRHLGGEQVLPPLGRTAQSLSRMPALQLRDDRVLSESVGSLVQIRRAFDAQTTRAPQNEDA